MLMACLVVAQLAGWVGLSGPTCIDLGDAWNTAAAGGQPKWALFMATTKNYDYAGVMFTSYQECQEAGKAYAAHYDGDGNPLYECRLVVKDTEVDQQQQI